MTDFTEEEWEIIIRSRERLRWIDTLPDPQRQWAIAGVPEEDWPQLTDFVSETLDILNGRTERVWVPNPRYMEYQQPVGHWETRARK